MAAAFAARPGGEDPWPALRAAIQVCVDDLQRDRAGLQRARMLASTPSLRTALRDKQARWADGLVPLVVARVQGREDDRELIAQALVSSALSCLDVAAMAWTRQDGLRSLDDLVDTAFAAVRS